MIPLEELPIHYQRKYYEAGSTRRKELRDFHLHEARFCELKRIDTVKTSTSDAYAYNKLIKKLGYNICVVSRGDRIFGYKTDDDKTA